MLFEEDVMADCACGKHCCHLKIQEETLTETTRLGFVFQFVRTVCANCGTWISDRVI